jgi:hypothetical protein
MTGEFVTRLRASKLGQTETSAFLEARNYHLHYYAELITHVITLPTVLSAYVLAVWSLTANIGLTDAFPWPTGPLSNWLIWLGLAVLLSLLASKFQRTERTHRLVTED